jgi:hypothetical protein
MVGLERGLRGGTVDHSVREIGVRAPRRGERWCDEQTGKARPRITPRTGLFWYAVLIAPKLDESRWGSFPRNIPLWHVGKHYGRSTCGDCSLLNSSRILLSYGKGCVSSTVAPCLAADGSPERQ